MEIFEKFIEFIVNCFKSDDLDYKETAANCFYFTLKEIPDFFALTATEFSLTFLNSINDLLNEKLFTKSNNIFDYSFHNLHLMRQYMDPLEIDIILNEMNSNLYAYSRYEPIYSTEFETNYEYDEYEYQLKDEILKNKYKKQKKRDQKNKK